MVPGLSPALPTFERRRANMAVAKPRTKLPLFKSPSGQGAFHEESPPRFPLLPLRAKRPLDFHSSHA